MYLVKRSEAVSDQFKLLSLCARTKFNELFHPGRLGILTFRRRRKRKDAPGLVRSVHLQGWRVLFMRDNTKSSTNAAPQIRRTNLQKDLKPVLQDAVGPQLIHCDYQSAYELARRLLLLIYALL